jgi:hypothetical protein
MASGGTRPAGLALLLKKQKTQQTNHLMRSKYYLVPLPNNDHLQTLSVS